MVSPMNVRFASGVEAQLASYVRASAQSKNSIVNTAVAEWLKMQAHPRIRFLQVETGERRAALTDGPQVWVVADSWNAHEPAERTAEVVARTTGLPVVAVDAALDYWAENRDEIDGVIERHHAAQEEAFAAWEARRRLRAA